MPQEQLGPSFEQVTASNPVEQVPLVEQITEIPRNTVSEKDDQLVSAPIITPSPSQPVATPVKQLTQRQLEIDDILEDGLAEIYVGLSSDKQQELRQVGEQTVRKIDSLLDQAKSQLNKIIGLIRSFLLVIPGMNRFFLEQEVKIKTDKIIALKGK